MKDEIKEILEENIKLKKKIKFNEKSRRKMQQSLMIKLEKYKDYIFELKEENNNLKFMNESLSREIELKKEIIELLQNK